MKLWYIAAAVCLLNIPFGYWRQNVRKFSTQWVLAVHLPVPFVIAMRIFGRLGWHLSTFPVLIGAYFTGQFFGGYLQKQFTKLMNHPTTSCLVIDLAVLSKNRFLEHGDHS
ncbi:MAG: hypothetical protein GXO91_07680 [FCB group bacterium]|nr:hypothetical protein [FCB group bacterium]